MLKSYAKKVLKDEILKVTTDSSGIPFVDSYGTNSESTAILNSGILKEIYGDK